MPFSAKAKHRCMYISSYVIDLQKYKFIWKRKTKKKINLEKNFAMSGKSTNFAPENEEHNNKYNPLSFVSKYQE
jgi:hypothetical protein